MDKTDKIDKIDKTEKKDKKELLWGRKDRKNKKDRKDKKDKSDGKVKKLDYTMQFPILKDEAENLARQILLEVYQALKEKGYNPLNQLVGYLLSGEPAYITSHRNVRSLIRKVERDELIEELVRSYIIQAEEDALNAAEPDADESDDIDDDTDDNKDDDKKDNDGDDDDDNNVNDDPDDDIDDDK